MMSADNESPVILPFGGFRERIQAEQKAGTSNEPLPNLLIDKEKKSLPVAEILRQGEPNVYSDEERLAAHFRKFKAKAPPYTAEYITTNRFSDLDAEVRSNALEKYKQSFAEKNFPFEYENPGEISEPRIYFDEDGVDEFSVDTGSGERDPYHLKGNFTSLIISKSMKFCFTCIFYLTFTDKDKMDGKLPKNMEYLMNFWREITGSKLKPQGALYAEGGPLKADDLQGEYINIAYTYK